MTDDLDPGHPRTAETSTASSAVMEPLVAPTTLVFGDVVELARSIGAVDGNGRDGAHRSDGEEPAAAPVNGRGAAAADGPLPADEPSPPDQAGDDVAGVVTDEERTRFGLLLDSAAERGLLDPLEYELRLRRLADATTTDEMAAIVTELPAFAPAPTSAHRSRRAIQSANREDSSSGRRRRMLMWSLMIVLVVVALISLVILALSAERLSRSRNSSAPPAPVAARPVSAPRL